MSRIQAYTNNLFPILIFCLGIGVDLLAQTKPLITNYNVRQYSPENLKASNQNWAIAQDNRGILFIGNNDIYNGILEYDGSKWTSYSTQPKNAVYSLAIDSSNRIFVGSNAAFGYLDLDEQGGYQFYSLSNFISDTALSFGNVWCIHVVNNLVFFQSSEAIFIWDGAKLTIMQASTSFHKSFTVNGEFWVRENQKGFFRYINNTLEPVKGLEFFAETRVDFILPFKNDILLFGTRTDGLYTYNQKDYKVETAKSSADKELKEHSIYGGLKLRNGNYAVATLNNGLYLLNENLSLNQHIGREDGLQSERIWNLLEDERSNLWLALNNGIDRVELNKTIKVAAEGSGYSGEINDLLFLPEGLFMATFQGIFKANTQKHEHWIKDKDGFNVQNDFYKIEGINEICWSMLFMDNDLLIGSNNNLYQLDLASKVKITEISQGKVMAMKGFPNMKNTFITGGNSIKIIRKVDGVWNQISEIDEVNGDVRTILVDQISNKEKSVVWIGDNGSALIRLELFHPDGAIQSYKVRRYTEQDGINVSYFHLTWIDQHLGIGTNDGLKKLSLSEDSIIDDQSLGEIFNGKEKQIWKVFGFENQEYWVVMNDKIYQVSLSNANLDEQIDSTTLRTLDLGNNNIFVKDEQNVLWIGCYEGLASIDLNKKERPKSNYYCTVRKVTLRGRKQLFKGNFYKLDPLGKKTLSQFQTALNIPELNNDENSLVFEFAAIRYESNIKLEYSYMLEGYDEEPSTWSKVNNATYTNLNPGEYRFIVRAKDIYGVVSDKAEFTFKINPPWYETTWFYMVQVGSLMGMVFLSYVYNRSGQNSKLSHILTLVTIITLFEFLILFFEGYVDDFSGGVPVFKLLMNVVLAISLNPIEKFIGRLLMLSSND